MVLRCHCCADLSSNFRDLRDCLIEIAFVLLPLRKEFSRYYICRHVKVCMGIIFTKRGQLCWNGLYGLALTMCLGWSLMSDFDAGGQTLIFDV